MQLETELGENYIFRNPYQKGSINVVYTYSVVFNAYEHFFRQYDITFQQYNILRILRNKYPNAVSSSTLRKLMLDKMSDVSRLTNRLRAKDLLSVTANAVDMRLVNINISEKGLRLLQEIDQQLHVLDSLLQDLTEAEVMQLNHLLDKARTSLRKIRI